MTSFWLTFPRAIGAATILLGLAAALWSGAERLPDLRNALSTPVYTVESLQRAAARDPADWLGRTVLVRGQAVTYLTWSAPDSVVHRMDLVDPPPARHYMVRVALEWGHPDPLLALLRRLPVVGRWAPQPQRLYWDRKAIYRLQIDRVPDGQDVGTVAVLLDAAPE